jgi:hypothetical protein
LNESLILNGLTWCFEIEVTGDASRVVEGMDVVKKLEAKGSPSGGPTAQCAISECGEL